MHAIGTAHFWCHGAQLENYSIRTGGQQQHRARVPLERTLLVGLWSASHIFRIFARKTTPLTCWWYIKETHFCIGRSIFTTVTFDTLPDKKDHSVFLLCSNLEILLCRKQFTVGATLTIFYRLHCRFFRPQRYFCASIAATVYGSCSWRYLCPAHAIPGAHVVNSCGLWCLLTRGPGGEDDEGALKR